HDYTPRRNPGWHLQGYSGRQSKSGGGLRDPDRHRSVQGWGSGHRIRASDPECRRCQRDVPDRGFDEPRNTLLRCRLPGRLNVRRQYFYFAGPVRNADRCRERGELPHRIRTRSVGHDFCDDLAASAVVSTSFPDSTTLAGVTVQVVDGQGATPAAPIYFVSAHQINLLLPAKVALGSATINVTRSNGSTASTSVTVT